MVRCDACLPVLPELEKIINVMFNDNSGMLFLHSTSPPIIHRDLKSANILLQGNRAKVTGMPRKCSELMGINLTTTSTDFGLSTVHALTTQVRQVDNPLGPGPR